MKKLSIVTLGMLTILCISVSAFAKEKAYRNIRIGCAPKYQMFTIKCEVGVDWRVCAKAVCGIRAPRSGDDNVISRGEPAGKAQDANSALFQVSTTRGTAPGPTGRDEKPGISDQGTAGGLIAYRTAPPPKVGTWPAGIAGDPIPGTEVGLEGDPEGIVVGATTTDARGAFTFTKLAAGSYRITLAGLPSTKVEVGTNGTIMGKVLLAKDGKGPQVVPYAVDVQRR